MDSERFWRAVVSSRCVELGPAQDFSSGLDGVEFVGLGPVLGRLCVSPVELDHPLLSLRQRDREPSPIATRALDSPGSLVGNAVTVYPSDRSDIAIPVGGESGCLNHTGC